ncbi:Transposase, Mutator family [Parageobacillus thermantarcticus]|uniref:Mutator family transposase n=2 Tax=Parageobacillus thermantarcticus TaxID=186116 RepID=A0A1I0TPX3_9BACL|nr:Transposase, Mutator family [Parageobacillus thermantarcticus]
MQEEIKNFLEIEQADTSNMRNGYYQRNLDTQYGRIEGLLVPRDRNGEFQTQLFAPYQRHTGWLEEAIIRMYQSGMSTREIGKFIERILGTYSPATISRITDVVKKISKNGTLVHYPSGPIFGRLVRETSRDTVVKEVIDVVLGVNEEGYREVLDFFVGGQESAYGWREILQQLYKRGVQEVLLGVFDGLPGLEEAFLSGGLSESRCAALCRSQSPQHPKSCSEKRPMRNGGRFETHLSTSSNKSLISSVFAYVSLIRDFASISNNLSICIRFDSSGKVLPCS